jgi:lipoate---protein ligase
MWMDSWVLNTPKQFWPTFKKKPILFRFFETQTTCVVLANSNKTEIEVQQDLCQSNNVPILRRKGGGGTVVLGTGCVVLSFAFYADHLFNNEKYFQAINSLWIQCLAQLGYYGLETLGISDIAFKNKKLAGTSMFRKKHLVVYQGSLLVDPNFETIFKLLKHPSKEPDYRKNRNHKEFLTSLKGSFEQNYQNKNHSALLIAKLCQGYMEEILKQENVLSKLHLENTSE